MSHSGPTRRTVLRTLSATAGTLATARAQSTGVTAKTVYGQVRGASKDGIVVFKGIPLTPAPSR